jgi:hypothetical protein
MQCIVLVILFNTCLRFFMIYRAKGMIDAHVFEVYRHIGGHLLNSVIFIVFFIVNYVIGQVSYMATDMASSIKFWVRTQGTIITHK